MRLEIETDAGTDVVDVTDPVRDAIPHDHEGTATVFVRHTTAGVVINEAERRLLEDVASFVATFARGGSGERARSPDAGDDDTDVASAPTDRSVSPAETRAGQEWRHDELDGNAASHLRALLLGPGVTVPVRDGDLSLGRWQSVLLVECDGPRTRTVDVVA